MIKRVLAIGLVGACVALTSAFAPTAHAGGGGNVPPVFTSRSPESVRVNLSLGQNSFECTGTAIDLDSTDPVYFFVAGNQPFMSFESTPGNPGSFRLHAENLVDTNRGTYFVDVAATDSLTNPNATIIGFIVRIFPEPSLLLSVLVGVTLIGQRNRN